jgi:two-component sensor histidine kinase
MLKRLAALRAWPFWLRFAAAGAALAGAHASQVPIENQVPGEPFLLFFIIVIASTLAFGELVGFLTCGASTILSMNYFEPAGVLAVKHASDLIKIELYGAMCALSVLGVGRLQEAILLLNRTMSNNERKSALLLREMAHRTSNNFAIVAALIKSKASSVNEPDAKSTLEEAVEQVLMIARLNRNLHLGGGGTAVDGESFISELASDLSRMIGKSREVSITSNAVSCTLPIEQAVPLGLIVNELVTNALKHAFPEGRTGSIQIELRDEPDNRLVLTVGDDGIGFRAGDLKTGTGQTLIAALAEQLNGRFESRSEKAGALFCVTFPRRAPAAAK